MNRVSTFVLCVFLVSAFAVTVAASGDTPETRVAAYHQALLDGDSEAATSMLSEKLLLFEDGEAETSRDHYAGGHMKVDIAFSKNAKRELESQSSWVEGDTATVSSTYDVKTRYKGKRYHLKSAETMILTRRDGQWFIVHIHWSNRSVKE